MASEYFHDGSSGGALIPKRHSRQAFRRTALKMFGCESSTPQRQWRTASSTATRSGWMLRWKPSAPRCVRERRRWTRFSVTPGFAEWPKSSGPIWRRAYERETGQECCSLTPRQASQSVEGAERGFPVRAGPLDRGTVSLQAGSIKEERLVHPEGRHAVSDLERRAAAPHSGPGFPGVRVVERE